MKRTMLFAAIIAALSFNAFAGNDGEGPNGNDYGLHKNKNNNFNANFNSSSSRSNAEAVGVGVGIGIGEGGDAAAVSGSNAFNSLNVNYEQPGKVHYEIENRGRIKNTPSMEAPSLATGGNDVCMGSTSGGASGPGFGVTLGSTWTDEDCERRKNAAILFNMGHANTARHLLCANAAIASAFAASGEFKCAEPQQSASSSAPTQVSANTDLYR